MPRRQTSTKSPAQREALERNFKILRLRGMHAQFNILDFTPHERKIGKDLIDRLLTRMGALTESQHLEFERKRIAL